MICRIDLEKTNYKQIDFTLLGLQDFPACENIYKKYIDHNEIENPHPVFEEEWNKEAKYNADVFGYFDDKTLIAWSLTYKFPSKKTVIADQFAWDYNNPKLKLGYRTIRSECSYYKQKGYKYFILGDPDKYKEELQGYEIIERGMDGIFSS
tara:strand:+ start:3894 stop:4346 length:453 start_codon:yes stop_codon:yes gene_type:complete